MIRQEQEETTNMVKDKPVSDHTETREATTVPVRGTHTPGPWQVSHRAGLDGYPYYAIHGFSGDAKRDTAMHEANARLIASAPELLAALKGIVRGYDGPTVDIGTSVSSYIATARAAIAKAEGDRG